MIDELVVIECAKCAEVVELISKLIWIAEMMRDV
jgi:hypothetical protein